VAVKVFQLLNLNQVDTRILWQVEMRLNLSLDVSDSVSKIES